MKPRCSSCGGEYSSLSHSCESTLKDVLEFVDAGPRANLRWLEAAEKIYKHCAEFENVDQCACRILAKNLIKLRLNFSTICPHSPTDSDCRVCNPEIEGKIAYRLLSNADAICPGDERLKDDCETWETLQDKTFIGQKYDGNFFVPMRRML